MGLVHRIGAGASALVLGSTLLLGAQDARAHADLDAVEAALDRWEADGKLPPETIAALRAEVREHTQRSSRRAVQYALASTGALILLLAAGVLGTALPLATRRHTPTPA